MILIPPLRTKRISARLKEVTCGAAIRLAGIHPRQHEYAVSEFLRVIVENADTPTDKHVADPRLWTVQERTLAVCHYLAAISPNGEADFGVGEAGKLTDYMDTSRDFVESVPLGFAAEDHWVMVPITGVMAESIERLDGSVDGVAAGRVHWLIGSMAVQMRRVDTSGAMLDQDPPTDDAGIDEWLQNRISVFAALPESDFVQLLALRGDGMAGLRHFFDMDVSGDGLVAMPKEGGEGGNLPPARFPVDECISGVSKSLAGQLQGDDS